MYVLLISFLSKIKYAILLTTVIWLRLQDITEMKTKALWFIVLLNPVWTYFHSVNKCKIKKLSPPPPTRHKWTLRNLNVFSKVKEMFKELHFSSLHHKTLTGFPSTSHYHHRLFHHKSTFQLINLVTIFLHCVTQELKSFWYIWSINSTMLYLK